METDPVLISRIVVEAYSFRGKDIIEASGGAHAAVRVALIPREATAEYAERLARRHGQAALKAAYILWTPWGDTGGRRLYAGQTSEAFERFASDHLRTKPWWRWCTLIYWTGAIAARADLEDLEAHILERFRADPRHMIHNRRPAERDERDLRRSLCHRRDMELVDRLLAAAGFPPCVSGELSGEARSRARAVAACLGDGGWHAVEPNVPVIAVAGAAGVETVAAAADGRDGWRKARTDFEHIIEAKASRVFAVDGDRVEELGPAALSGPQSYAAVMFARVRKE